MASKGSKRGMAGLGALVMKAYPGKTREELEAVRVFGAWAKHMSPRITENARPVRLDRGILTLHTTTSAWANTLQLESTALLATLLRKVPGTSLRKLVFRAGKMPDAEAPPPPLPEPEPIEPAQELPEDVARELARIHDDDVRGAVAKAAAAGLGEARKRKNR